MSLERYINNMSIALALALFMKTAKAIKVLTSVEPSAWQVEQNHCPHGLAPFHSCVPHLKASSLPSSPTRQRWSETATPPWQQYRVLCDAFRPNNSPQSVVCRKRYPNGYKRPKFASTTELEYYIHVVSEAYVWISYICVNKLG